MLELFEKMLENARKNARFSPFFEATFGPFSE